MLASEPPPFFSPHTIRLLFFFLFVSRAHEKNPTMDQIHAAITELQAELQRQRDEITFLRSIITNRASAKPKASLPDPEKFSGHAQKFDTWLPSIRAKLQVDGDAIGDATAQFYYVYLNLESPVQAMVLP